MNCIILHILETYMCIYYLTPFLSFHVTGHRALEDILPKLLQQLDDPEHGESALDGLKQVMVVKSRVVMPFLVPKVGIDDPSFISCLLVHARSYWNENCYLLLICLTYLLKSEKVTYLPTTPFFQESLLFSGFIDPRKKKKSPFNLSS